MRKPIQYNFGQGQLLYAVLARGACVRVDIERPDGTPYGSGFSVHVDGVALGPSEFIAGTWGDHRGLMASAMMGTGWFERTGRSVPLPAGEENEVWRLSQMGAEWLAVDLDMKLSLG